MWISERGKTNGHKVNTYFSFVVQSNTSCASLLPHFVHFSTIRQNSVVFSSAFLNKTSIREREKNTWRCASVEFEFFSFLISLRKRMAARALTAYTPPSHMRPFLVSYSTKFTSLEFICSMSMAATRKYAEPFNEIERNILSILSIYHDTRSSVSLFASILFIFLPFASAIYGAYCAALAISVALSCFIGTHSCLSLDCVSCMRCVCEWYCRATTMRNLPTNTCNDYESNIPTEFWCGI